MTTTPRPTFKIEVQFLQFLRCKSSTKKYETFAIHENFLIFAHRNYKQTTNLTQ